MLFVLILVVVVVVVAVEVVVLLVVVTAICNSTATDYYRSNSHITTIYHIFRAIIRKQYSNQVTKGCDMYKNTYNPLLHIGSVFFTPHTLLVSMLHAIG